MDMDGGEASVQVAVRIRPVKQLCHEATAISFVDSTVAVTSDHGTEQTDVDHILVETFDKDAEASQARVFERLGEPIIRGAVRGISQGIVFYGASGSGKTYTVLGTREKPGLLSRLERALLRPDFPDTLNEVRVWFSALEIFNDQVQDMLATKPLSERRHAPVFLHHPILGVQVVGATETPVESCNVEELIDFSLKRRALGRTCLHASSSRSTQVYCFRVEVQGASGQQSTARVYLFDLAAPSASRRATCSSLTALQTTVRELSEGSRPRDSTSLGSPLTLALRDALQGSWCSLLVATLCAGSQHASESAATLRFAREMRQLQTRPVASKTRPEQLQLLQEEVAELRKEADQLGLGSMLKASLDDRSSLIAEIVKQTASQMEESFKLARQRTKALEWCGLLTENSEDLRRKDTTTPYLLNMSDDPVLAGCLLYYLPQGERISIGSDLDSTIVFDGLGILPNLCSIINSDDRHLSMARPDFARRHVLHNGKMLITSDSVQLSDNDRVCLGRAQLLLLKIPLQSKAEQKPLQLECMLPGSLSELLPALQVQEDITFEMVHPLLEHSDSLKNVQCYVKDLLPKLPASNGLACFTVLREVCYLLDEANLITREVRPEDHMHFQVELIWDIERNPEEVLLIALISYGKGIHTAPATGALPDCQVLHYWSYRRFLEKLDEMREVHRLHCQGLNGWTGRGDPFHDPWMEPSADALKQYLLTCSSCQQAATTCGYVSMEHGRTLHKASAGYATAEGDQLRGRIDELVQELEDKNAELEEKDQIVSELKEQMVQITHLLGGFAPEAAQRFVLEQPEPEAPCSKEKRDSPPSDTEHSCTMTVSASTSEGGFGVGDTKESPKRSRGFRVDNFGASKGNHGGAALLSQSSLTPPHYYRDLRR